jgi:RNA polymerase sigma factor (TIGR02999 family)
MNEITLLLKAAGAGDAQAADRVVALLYADLQRLARSRLRRAGEFTQLDTTALVHEAYLRLQGQAGLAFEDRARFLAYAARVMHSVVVDLVRARQAERRGGQLQQVTFSTAVADMAQQTEDQVLQVHEALQALAAQDPRLAQVVEMRYFAGLSEADIAEGLQLTERTVQRDWQKAKLFLAAMLRQA